MKNALAMAILLMSGLQILNAHPALYWGKGGFAPNQAWFDIYNTAGTPPEGILRIGRRAYRTTGFLGVFGAPDAVVIKAFPGWLTVPSWRDLATGRRWHFFFAWVLVLNGALYLGYCAFSGHLWRDLKPTLREIEPRHLALDLEPFFIVVSVQVGVAMLRFVDRRIIRRVRHVHHQRHVRLERIRDLPRAEQADFLLDVRNRANFRVQFLFDSLNNRIASATAKVPMRLSNARATARSLRNKSNSSFSVIGSPIWINFSASFVLFTPMSMNKSCIFGSLWSSSCRDRCGATLPTTPFTGPLRV